MSIKNSIANCKTPFATGSSRQCFYSKRYGVVIKKEWEPGWNYETAQRQSEKEQEIFEQLSPAEKEFFPIIGFEKDKDGKTVILMKKIESTLEELGLCPPDTCLEDSSIGKQKEFLSWLKKEFGLKFNATCLLKLISKHHLRDLHNKNLGIYQGKLVIIDFGW